MVLFCTIFFCIYSNFNQVVIDHENPKFSSPDETGNYFWIDRFASGQPTYYFEDLNGVGTNLLHLRGMNTIEGRVTPGSFIGMTVTYGMLAKVFSTSAIPYLTPIFAILGLIFFYLLINKLFKNSSIALISTVLLSFFPGYLYYASRGMYHNILFISLSIIGIYLLLKALELKDKKYLNQSVYFLSGLTVGLAIITRTSEIVWLAMTVLLIFIFNFKRINWLGLIAFLAGLWIPALILLYYNQILYGAFISAGYRAIVPSGGIGEAIKSGILFRILVSPFGFEPKSILINGYNYLVKFLPFWSAGAALGGILFLTLPKKLISISFKRRIIYLVFFLLISLYLLIFYGSWQFSDRIDETTLSLGTSYLRYWLPIYLLAIPFLATLIWQITKLVTAFKLNHKNIYRTIISAILVLLLFMPTINMVFRQTDESLFLLKNLSNTRLKSELVTNKIESNDVIVIYKQADKIFFPERDNIITDLVVDADYEAVANLAKFRSVYYYTFAPPATVEFISKRDFEPHGMEIVEGQRILGTDWLYKIKLR